MLRRGEELEHCTLYTVSNNVSSPLHCRCRKEDITWSTCTLLAIICPHPCTAGAEDRSRSTCTLLAIMCNLSLLQVLKRGEDLKHLFTVSNNVSSFSSSGAQKREGPCSTCTLSAIMYPLPELLRLRREEVYTMLAIMCPLSLSCRC